MTKLIATASTTIDAPPSRVWSALVDPAAIKRYMFGTTVSTDWRVGSEIVWRGEWDGRHYEDRGVIVQVEPGRALKYTHFSPLSGLPDLPENYHAVAITLEPEAQGTRVTLTQDNNSDEQAREHSQQNWAMMLEGLKKLVEGERQSL